MLVSLVNEKIFCVSVSVLLVLILIIFFSYHLTTFSIKRGLEIV